MFTPIHPILVHFPIAFLTFGVIAQFLALWKPDYFNKTAMLLLSLGWVTAFVSYLTGDGAEHFAEKTKGDAIEPLVHTHELFAKITLVIFAIVILLKIFGRFKKGSFLVPVILILCLLGAGSLTMTGYYGGEMVFHTPNDVHETPNINSD
ncbi:hypothetical protein LRR81_11015 [Metabacillus sp. GX 13764]|uniref:DUF2231 domain-containing protein n=1 Tax=Metabacillus kandeliae TaxID=2900151 RepID=UPI001E601074|nr:DUF2231 domain-containing protein [Metabacillus kandeliae]MCD7034774.1 hypothetical protein [Metabacillus kandeliae]